MQHSRRGTHRRARPSGFWPPWAWAGAWWAGAWWAGAWWAGAWWAGAHLGLGRELEGRLDLDEHALGDAELERVLERQVVLRMEARARRVSSLRVVLFAAAARRVGPVGREGGLEGDTRRRAVQEGEGCEGTPGRGGDR